MKLTDLFEEVGIKNDGRKKDIKNLSKTIEYLEGKKNILFLTTSNRGEWAMKELKEEPKSTKLAKYIQKKLGKSKCKLIEVPLLKIYPCEGNVSHIEGNTCGVKDSILKNKTKNPSGHHRCWRNINNPDDELWKISKELFEADALVIFGSVRWGQTSATYQNLIERLTWLENRHSTLKESNILKDIEAGVIFIGQNWNGKEIVKTQKQVLTFFGFDVKDELSWNWQFTNDPNDESKKSYKESFKEFNKVFKLDS